MAEPPGYRRADLLLLADVLDEDGRAGYVQVRGRRKPPAGEVGTRLGDLLLVAGRGEAVMVHDEPVNTLRRTEVWTVAVDAGHYLLTPSYMDGVSSLVDLSGETL